MRCVSLGAGVQSTCLLLMAEAGEIGPRPDFAIFSDTGWEPKAVYDNVERLKEHCSIPIVTVSGGNIREESIRLEQNGGFVTLPMYSRGGMLQRQCTADYKIRPIRKYLKAQFKKRGETGRVPEGWATIWIGISYDEIQRMKDANVKWIDHRWPLIEKRMNRTDCAEWLESYGWGEVQKSSCVGCPFHSDQAWAKMKRDEPEYFEDAVEFDSKMRNVGKLKAEAYLHKACKPLSEVEFGPVEINEDQMMLGDCDGFCHV